jgi:hypothetical protein
MIQHNTAPTEHEHEEAEQQPEPFMMFPPSYPFHDLSFIVVLHPQFSFVCHKRDKARLLQTKPESTRFPVHAAHPEGLNHPIVGDDLYGQPSDRLYLHAAALEFVHPVTGEKLRIVKESDF